MSQARGSGGRYRAVWAYPMDLIERGLEREVAPLARSGLTAVSVATAYHPVEALLPENPVRRWLVMPESEVFLPLEPRRTGALRPVVSRGASVVPIAEALRRHGLALTAWLVLTHSSLAARHPRVAARLVGGRVHRAALCPAHEAVQDYLVGLVEETERILAPEALDLESLGWNATFNPARVKVGLDVSPVASYLAALCVCGRCALREDRSLVRWMGVALGDALHGRARWSSVAELLEDQPDLGAFQRRREAVVTQLLGTLRASTRAPIHLVHGGEFPAAGLDRAAIAPLIERHTPLAYAPDPRVVRTVLDRASGWLGPERTVAGLSLQTQETPRRSTWRRVHAAVAASGVESWSVYNHSLVDARRLAWLGDGDRA